LCGSSTGASRRDHGGGSGSGLRDRSDVNDDRSNHSQVVDRCESSMMKTELTEMYHE